METGHTFLKDLRDFLQFLRSLWGVLAGISVLFPLSNAFVAVIPVDDGGRPFQDLPPAVVSAATMLTCIFLTFATFGRRDRFTDPRSRGRYARSARICFAGALAALAAYVLAPSGLYRVLITDNPDSAIGLALYDGLFAALYVLTFALLTRAFLLLAMLEYFAEASTEPAAATTASGVPVPRADGGQRQDAT
ncbi:hypothetical protein GCM10029963_14280 [Micromonospora andamanensis]|uniref:hypothetical protein n=1 Tax=Micromonospora andamanensis TaxID=1287068 RepID=UPI001951458A|nr:hypothetical protein [Micromonospora andamanensis]GIJ38774.1 hypothetical protein Vwe01_20990 [Micromonospora andamanensis]